MKNELTAKKACENLAYNMKDAGYSLSDFDFEKNMNEDETTTIKELQEEYTRISSEIINAFPPLLRGPVRAFVVVSSRVEGYRQEFVANPSLYFLIGISAFITAFAILIFVK